MARLRALLLWAALSVTAVRATDTQQWKPFPVSVETTTETVVPTCPPPLTLSSTQYVPTTIFETVIYTTILTTTTVQSTTETETETQSVTEIRPTTEYRTEFLTETTATTEFVTEFITETTPITQFVTETTATTQFVTETFSTTEIITQLITQFVTETTPTTELQTLTATEKQEIHTRTTSLTSIRVCPTRLVNPNFSVKVPLPNDWTWGCPPGWLCKPPKENCDIEAGLPDRGFTCSPDHCIPAEPLPRPLQTWDDTIYGNSTPATNPSLGINLIDSYFNMDPTSYGLTYEIFVIEQELTYTETIVLPPNPTSVPRYFPKIKARQGQTDIPPNCYPWCNNALLEVQSLGKSPEICESGSAFLTSVGQCRECIEYHADPAQPDSFVRIAPQFQQFIDYCDVPASTTVSTTVSTTLTSTSESGEPTLTTVSLTTLTSNLLPTDEPTATTYTGSQITPLTIVIPNGSTMTTLSGTDLEGATLILPAQASVTEIVTEVVVSSLASLSSLVEGASSESALEPTSTATSSSPVGTLGPEGGATNNGPSTHLLISMTILIIGILV